MMGLEVSTIEDISKVLWQDVPPYIIAIGTFGNVISIVVLLRRNVRRRKVSVYLIALSVVDTMVLWTGLLYHWVRYKYKYDFRMLSQFGCRVHRWATYFTLDLSVWILVAMTIERLFVVSLPHKVKKFCTIGKSIAVIILLAVAMAILCIHIVFGFGVKMIGNTNTASCTPLTANYKHFFHFIWNWIDLCIYSFIPFIIIVVSNVVIVYKVFVSDRSTRGTNVSTQQTTQETNRSRRVSSMTVLLVAINVCFLITTSPLSIYFLVYPTLNLTAMTKKELSLLYMTYALLSILQYLNNATNFFFYCLSGTLFRKELWTIISCGKKVGPIIAQRSTTLPENSTEYQVSSNKISIAKQKMMKLLQPVSQKTPPSVYRVRNSP